MYLDIENIDKDEKKTLRTICKAIGERYFSEVKLFPRSFINLCKKNPNDS